MCNKEKSTSVREPGANEPISKQKIRLMYAGFRNEERSFKTNDPR
jgi:hypothetical protein